MATITELANALSNAEKNATNSMDKAILHDLLQQVEEIFCTADRRSDLGVDIETTINIEAL